MAITEEQARATVTAGMALALLGLAQAGLLTPKEIVDQADELLARENLRRELREQLQAARKRASRQLQ